MYRGWPRSSCIYPRFPVNPAEPTEDWRMCAKGSEQSQTLFFKAATGKAFTTVFAGRAFTRTVLPNIFFSVALVAGLTRLLILHMPGSVNCPTVPISLVAMPARLLMTLVACFVLISNSPAIAFTRAPLVMAFLLAVAFAAFIALGGNILVRVRGLRRPPEERRASRLLDPKL